MARPPLILSCDGCGEDVPITRAQLHLGQDGVSIAWDHRLDSAGECSRYCAMKNMDSVPFESSARLANHLNVNGEKKRNIDFVKAGGVSAYYVRDVHDLLRLSATVIAPAGFEPVVTLSSSRPSASTLSSTVPLGVCHREGDRPEYIYLRLGVGDWLVTEGEDSELTLARMSGSEFRETMDATGIGPEDFKSLRRRVEL